MAKGQEYSQQQSQAQVMNAGRILTFGGEFMLILEGIDGIKERSIG